MAPLPPTPAPEAVIGWLLLNFCPFTSSVAPLLTVTGAAAVPRALVLPACKVPLATMIAPPKALFAPFKARTLAPFWVIVPKPEMTLGTARLSLRLKTRAAPASTLTLPAGSVPLVPPLPICKVPPLTVMPPVKSSPPLSARVKEAVPCLVKLPPPLSLPAPVKV